MLVSRWGRIALYAGIAAAIVGFSKAHAVAHSYSWSGSSRFAWSVAYTVFLGLNAYAFGLPDLVANRRRAWTAAIASAASAALVVSAVQSLVGDAYLPRFVVLGAAVVLVPWYVLCSVLTGDTRARVGERDRVVVVAAPEEFDSLLEELDAAPERPAVVVGTLPTEVAHSTSLPPTRPLVDVAHGARATVVVLSRAAQSVDDIVMQAAQLHQEGTRVRTLSMFYEQWLGKLPIGELERCHVVVRYR